MNVKGSKPPSNQKPLPWVTKRIKMDSWPVFVEIKGIRAVVSCPKSQLTFSPWHSMAGFSLFLNHATPWRSRDVQRVGTVWGLTGLYSQGTQLDTYQSLPFPYSAWGWTRNNVDLILTGGG